MLFIVILAGIGFVVWGGIKDRGFISSTFLLSFWVFMMFVLFGLAGMDMEQQEQPMVFIETQAEYKAYMDLDKKEIETAKEWKALGVKFSFACYTMPEVIGGNAYWWPFVGQKLKAKTVWKVVPIGKEDM